MPLYLDTETYLIAPGYIAPKPVCVSLVTPGNDPWVLDADRGASALEHALDAGDLIVGHNIVFDLAVLAEYRPHLLPKVFAHLRKGLVRCTMLRQRLIEIAQGTLNQPRPDGSRGYALVELEKHYLNRDRSEDKGEDAWRLRYAELDGVPLDQWPYDALRYAKEDVEGTMRIDQAQLAKYGAPADEENQMRADWALHLVRCHGFRTNAQTLDEIQALCERVRAEARERLTERGFFRWVGPKKEPKRKLAKDTKAVRAHVEACFAALGKTPPRTPSGGVKMDADTLEMTGDPDLIALAEAGPADTVLKTFIPALRPGTEYPLCSRFSLVETGRLSASDPNSTNQPRGFEVTLDGKTYKVDIRSAAEPRPGFLYASVDLDCAELRACAQNNYDLFGFSSMAELFQKNPHADPHLALAASILGISEEEAAARKEAGDKEIKGLRQMCKAINFGLPGGMGAARLVESARKGYGVEMTEDEARLRKQQWFARWPEMKTYLDYIGDMVGFGDATIEHLWSKRKQGGLNFCNAANAYFQGRIADLFKLALFEVLFECFCAPTSPLFGSRVVVPAHDEIIAEVPKDIAHEAAFRIAEIMVEAARVVLPNVPCTASPALMERWHKAAEPTYDEAGRLVPWRPAVI